MEGRACAKRKLHKQWGGGGNKERKLTAGTSARKIGDKEHLGDPVENGPRASEHKTGNLGTQKHMKAATEVVQNVCSHLPGKQEFPEGLDFFF